MTEEGCEPPGSHAQAPEFGRQGFESGFQPGFTINRRTRANVLFLGVAVCRVTVEEVQLSVPVLKPEFRRKCPQVH